MPRAASSRAPNPCVFAQESREGGAPPLGVSRGCTRLYGSVSPVTHKLPWYDSQWLLRYLRAKELLASRHPARAEEFVAAFAPLRTHSSFREQLLERAFDEAELETIRSVVRSVRPEQLEMHEIVVPWPEHFRATDAEWKDEVGRHAFRSYAMEPGQTLVFSGSSQWHYRDAFPGTDPRGSCTLLFFHFFPAGTRELIDWETWERRFDAPGLGELLGPYPHPSSR